MHHQIHYHFRAYFSSFVSLPGNKKALSCFQNQQSSSRVNSCLSRFLRRVAKWRTLRFLPWNFYEWNPLLHKKLFFPLRFVKTGSQFRSRKNFFPRKSHINLLFEELRWRFSEVLFKLMTLTEFWKFSENITWQQNWN